MANHDLITLKKTWKRLTSWCGARSVVLVLVILFLWTVMDNWLYLAMPVIGGVMVTVGMCFYAGYRAHVMDKN